MWKYNSSNYNDRYSDKHRESAQRVGKKSRKRMFLSDTLEFIWEIVTYRWW